MEAYKVREAYKEWVNKQSFDLLITLNTEAELAKEQMGKLMCRLFYKTECDVFGYSNREKYRNKL